MRVPNVRRGMACALVALGLAASTLPALAAPEEPGDVITRLLSDKGLLRAEPGSVVATTPATPAPAGSPATFAQRMRDRASEMIVTAMTFLGVPYKRGGTSIETGFDCSGFTRHIFNTSLGLVLPRTSDEQATAAGLMPVKREDLKPGDLVFFNTLKRTFSHVGIYVGEGRFIHSPRAGGEVRVEDMGMAYWAKRFTGARRAQPLNEAHDPAAVATSADASASQPAATTLSRR